MPGSGKWHEMDKKTTQTGESEWLSPEDLAMELGIPLGTIYRWRSCHTGPRGHRMGRHVRFRRSDIESWIQSKSDGD